MDTTEDLNPKEHQILSLRMGEYPIDLKLHHVHIPISLDKINRVADLAIEQVKAYAKNVYQESMIIITRTTNMLKLKDLKGMQN
jgi:hypothetical protein